MKHLTLLVLLVIFISCEKKEDNKLPKLMTKAVYNVSTKSAISGGEVIDNGGSPIITKGICWSRSERPTIEDDFVEDSSGDSIFTSLLSDINDNTKYYVRSYAINNEGVTYGNQVSFISEAKFVDQRDGESYDWVTIGEQIWMAENLRYLPQYANISFVKYAEYPLYGVYNYSGNDADEAKAYLIEDNDVSINPYEEYGVFYNWYAALRTDMAAYIPNVKIQGICPDGWHLPSLDEVEGLEDFLSSQGHAEYEGNALKSRRGWKDSEIGVDYYGFNALPAGYRSFTGEYDQEGEAAAFWLSSMDEPDFSAMNYHFYNDKTLMTFGRTGKTMGLNVRCIRD